jgi:flagellin-like hook-associated protein FlgL
MPTVNTTVATIKAKSNLDKVRKELNTSIAPLSAGKQITRAHDDASIALLGG